MCLTQPSRVGLSKSLRPGTIFSKCVYIGKKGSRGSGLVNAQDNEGSQNSPRRKKQTLNVNCSRVGFEPSPPDFPRGCLFMVKPGALECGEGHQLSGDPISLKPVSSLFSAPSLACLQGESKDS